MLAIGMMWVLSRLRGSCEIPFNKDQVTVREMAQKIFEPKKWFKNQKKGRVAF